MTALALMVTGSGADAVEPVETLSDQDEAVFTGKCSCPLCTGAAGGTLGLSAAGDPVTLQQAGPGIIEYFTAGSPPVQWTQAAMPVPICTHQAHRPAWVSADVFRNHVAQAAQVWNDAGAAVGYHYTGDCNASVPRAFRNGVNEIAFDSSPNNEVQSPTAALTHGAWNASREFIEIDVILHADLQVADQCLFSVIVHELGHGIGFGHSTSPGDLMYPTFDGQQISSCVTAPTAAEKAWLVDLYGPNQKPVVNAPENPNVFAGVVSNLSVSANDPDGGPLTYLWSQTSGPSVAFTANGSSISFAAPGDVGAQLVFQVQVFDQYGARTIATITAHVQERPPPGAISGELPSQGGFGLIIWQGGIVESLVIAASDSGCQLISVWTSIGGRLYGYTPGAPAFVNQAWTGYYPGELPDGLPLLAVCARR